MFNFNSYLKLRYWLRERIILWGLGCLRVGELESCMEGFGFGKGKVYKTVPFIYDIVLILTGRSHGA